MKTLLLTSALLITATSASAFTCKNTVAMVDGEWAYTSSQCGTQAPASAEVLEMITYIANNPPKDNQEEEAVTEVVTVEDVTVELTRLEKLLKREGKLTAKNHAHMDTLRKLATKFGGSNPQEAIKMLNESIYHRSIGKAKYADKQLALANTLSNFDNWSVKAKARAGKIVPKMENIRDKKNKVEARIAKQ